MTEPGTGSDLAGIATRATKDGPRYVLDGTKTFITNGINADLVVVAARTSEDKHSGLSLFVVERGMPGFERGKQIEKLGQHASDTAELFFNDVSVPVENMLGEEGTGFLQLVSRLVPERLTLAVTSIAGCELALDLTLAYVKERTAFGKPIGWFQHSRFTLAELKTKVEITRCFVDRCIERYVAGTCSVQEAAMAKWWTTDLLCEIADAGVQLHGGYGYTTDYQIGKVWLDARVGRIYAGTNEIIRNSSAARWACERADAMSRKVYVIGVGMTKFDKPGTKQGDYRDWAREAGEQALADARVPYAEVPAGLCRLRLRRSTCSAAPRAATSSECSGIPVFNVNSNCSTGSSALFLAAQAIRGSIAEMHARSRLREDAGRDRSPRATRSGSSR